MPKKSITARQRKRESMVEKYASKYKKLKKEGDYLALDKLPKNASRVRLKKRCWSCERGRFILKRFILCRICFRHKAANGKIPGVTKSSA
ncbi:MAG: 30S ribosomal protein S14 [Bacteroidota bacterium]